MQSPRPTLAGDDYRTVSCVIAYLTENYRDQPELDELARHVGMTPTRLQKLFTRWCGLSPKGFLQAVTLDHARRLLEDSASVLDTTYEVGLSGPGRLHDLFVSHHAMTPGAYKGRGAGMEMVWGFHPSPFGKALLMATEYGLTGLAFAEDGPGSGNEEKVLAEMQARYPKARYRHAPQATAPLARRVFDTSAWREEEPLRVVFIGSDFEVRVWESLLQIPFASATTYSDIAKKIERPKAARAVGAAVGRNPISFVVPCHRVLGRSGALTGYHWGLTRKRAMLGWETGMAAAG
nr:bifunctional helix-turn-helix domain-containing protein/methylated-DNA--[protein]-cysteine S-methyltransferase [Afifella pfennigii]